MSSSIKRDDSLIPPGFVEEEPIESQLYHEDLSEDDELWLIRMPSNIELSELDRKKIFLSDNIGHECVKDIKTENGMLLECLSENCEIPNLNVVLPQKSDNKLRCVNKKFKGTILISEGLVLEDNKEIKTEKENEVKVKSEDELPEDSFGASEGKKKRKKKQHLNLSENSDVNYNTEDSERISTSSKKKHSKKHADMSENMSLGVEVKNELFSMDLDSFPTCNSQK